MISKNGKGLYIIQYRINRTMEYHKTRMAVGAKCRRINYSPELRRFYFKPKNWLNKITIILYCYIKINKEDP